MKTMMFATAALSMVTVSTAASAIDPEASRSANSASAYSDDGGRKVAGIGGIFGCSADGSKQEIGAVAGGILGGFLGNRIAGRGNRTLGTLLGGALGAAAGSAVGCKLQKDDRAKAERAMEQAVLTGQDQSWSSADSGASGVVEVGSDVQGVSLADLKLARGVEPASGYTKVDAPFVASSTVNVRAAPGTAAPILTRLAHGQRVWVPAAVEGQPWLLVSDGGVGQGYVSAPLLRKALTNSKVASGCRMVRQTVSLPGQAAETETLQACKSSDGQWVMTRV